MTHPLPDDLAHAANRAGVRLRPFTQITWYPEVASTNDLVLARAEAGEDEGIVVAADAQSRGRGRMGRAWSSPAGSGIYMSALLRPPSPTALITLAAGVGVAEGIRAATGLQTTLKWPNDIYAWPSAAAARKLGGILAEGGTSSPGGAFVVLGIGINVQQSAYPPAVAARASSLEDELGREVDRALLLVESLAGVARRYDELMRGGAAAVLAAWSALAAPTFGARVEWEADGTMRSGAAEGIDATGALRVRTDSGVTRIISGEVRWTF